MKTTTISRAFVEGGGYKYIVGVVVEGGKKVDLAVYRHDGSVKSVDEAYSKASAAAASIKRGFFMARYAHGKNPQEHLCTVRGATLTISAI